MNEIAFRKMFVTLFPRARHGVLDAICDIAVPRLKLLDEFRLSFFLAQTAHESLGYSALREFGSESYFGRYEGRVDLGNTKPGDGPRFRGRGILQVTGRANYERLARDERWPEIVAEPTLLETPVGAVRSCCWYWEKRDLNRFADLCSDDPAHKSDNFRKLTKAINGGYNGLGKRLVLLAQVEDAIGSFVVFE